MPSLVSSFRQSGILLIAFTVAVAGQAVAQSLRSIEPIAFDTAGPSIRAHTESQKPFTVTGEQGVVLGQQDGTFEAWVLPVKVLSHLTIEADVEGYTVPIDVNQQAAEIEVRPDRTVITYTHIGFTVRQIMFSPADGPAGTGPMVLFEFDCVHPTDFTLRFTPELRWMWPERNEGVPSVEWVAPPPKAYEKAGGFYVLHSDYPDFAAAITIPGARPGILAPYQERPQIHPVELKLHIDPARDRGRLFPLLMAVGMNQAAANSAALGATLERLNAGIAASHQTHAEGFRKLLANSVSIETPDKTLNEAFQWAEISIEQLRTKVQPPRQQGPSAGEQGMNETGLVAGYYASGDSARPGFGWFFGRDALYTLYAVNGYGDFALSKSELEFLMHRQREDGKIMHEYSQTADDIDWKAFPYMYAAADATPLFLLGVLDYVRSSGDVAFLTAHRDVVEKAWAFETGHAPGPDKGGNGIYENTQGTGWVESWPGGMPHQEVYLALLDQQASGAMAKMQELLGDKRKTEDARRRAEAVQKTIESQFYDLEKSCYVFSRNADGSLDRASTVYPALAWWSSKDVTGNSTFLAHPEDCLRQLASHTLNTDWGLRDVSNEEKIYDGMSYHQGSVWPLFTGWGALAEYRGGQPLAGYQMLMENANLTRAQDLGAVTELLSGDYFVPFGRSTSHQLWSSAMVITPILRGMFGIDVDAQTKTITVNPHLPASWDGASVRNLQLPGGTASLVFRRENEQLDVRLILTGDEGWHLRSNTVGASSGSLANTRISAKMRTTPEGSLRIPIPSLEVDQVLAGVTPADAAGAMLPNRSPLPGTRTSSFRILHSEFADRKLILIAEGLAGSEGVVGLIRHGRFIPRVQADAGSDSTGDKQPASVINPDDCNAGSDACKRMPLLFHFPPGEGWKTITVTLNW